MSFETENPSFRVTYWHAVHRPQRSSLHLANLVQPPHAQTLVEYNLPCHVQILPLADNKNLQQLQHYLSDQNEIYSQGIDEFYFEDG